MIELTKDEINAFNMIAMQAQNLQAQLQQAQGAQKALIALLENKYKATLNPETGQLQPKEKK